MYFVLLYSNRDVLSDQAVMIREADNGYPNLGHLKFLVDSYKAQYYYFELVEVVRRLILASVIGLIDPSSAVSAVIGLIICVGFNWVYVALKPYKDPGDSGFAIMLSISLTLLFLAALIIKVEHTSELGFGEETMGVSLCVILVSGPLILLVGQLLLMIPASMRVIKKYFKARKRSQLAAAIPVKEHEITVFETTLTNQVVSAK